MTRELFILRHSKSDWSRDNLDDHSRPLNSRGQKDARLMAKWMKSKYFYPGMIYCSTAERARQTTAPLIETLGVDESNVRYDDGLYLASLATLLQVLSGVDSNQSSILIVAHNPGLDELVSYLSTTPPPLTAHGKLMTTTCLAHFKMPENWDALRNKAELLSITRPNELET